MSERQYGMGSDIRVGNDIHELPGDKMYGGQRGACGPYLLAYFLEECASYAPTGMCASGDTRNSFTMRFGDTPALLK